MWFTGAEATTVRVEADVGHGRVLVGKVDVAPVAVDDARDSAPRDGVGDVCQRDGSDRGVAGQATRGVVVGNKIAHVVIIIQVNPITCPSCAILESGDVLYVQRHSKLLASRYAPSVFIPWTDAVS